MNNTYIKKETLTEKKADVTEVTYDKIYVKGIEGLHLEVLTITQEINEHACLELEALVSEEEQENTLDYFIFHGTISIFYHKIENGEQKEIPLFCGIVKEAGIILKKGFPMLKIKAYSASIKLEEKKKSRSFQDIHMSYQKAITKVLSDYQNVDIKINTDRQEEIKQFILQYEQTDWEFLKRLASMQHTCLITDIQFTAPKIYYGIGGKNIYYSLSQMDEYQYKKLILEDNTKNGDGIFFQVKTNAIFQIGDFVSMKDRFCTVTKAKYQILNGVLKGIYECSNGFEIQIPRIYQENLGGMSLKAKVKGVSRDLVRIQLNLDKEETGEYYFPYATLAASLDGSGWYFMPEIEDSVRLYFPDNDETNAYVVSSVSEYLPKEGADKMENPEVKYIRTIHSHEIQFSEKGIQISAGNGNAKIVLDKNGNISLTARNNIRIGASKNIIVQAGDTLALLAGTKLELAGKGSEILLDKAGGVVLKGAYINEN